MPVNLIRNRNTLINFRVLDFFVMGGHILFNWFNTLEVMMCEFFFTEISEFVDCFLEMLVLSIVLLDLVIVF